MGKKLTIEEAITVIRARCKETPSGCWEYQGGGNELGYVQMTFHGKKWMVHRFIFWHVKGPFDLSLDCCHKCDNPPCCNPDHIFTGDPKANGKDCVEKGRHYKAVRTHCPKGHLYAEHGVEYVKGKNWRTCKICALARSRISHGWPEDLAYSLPRVPPGQTPVNINIKRGQPKKGRPLQTHCRRGHPLEGDNIYKKPSGTRQCKTCHDAAVKAWLARGKVPLNKTVTV